MSATFDTTTKAAYDAATTAQLRAEAVVASLSGTISIKVFDGTDTEMGSGTMAAPWAVATAGAVVIGEVSSFTVGTTATPDANWYLRLQNADVSRWVKGSFGLAASGQDFTWSLGNWTATHTGTIGTATIVCAGNQAPVFTVAPTTASIGAGGGTIQFTATDPEGGSVFYSLTTTRAGITINSSGLVSVAASAAGTSGNIVVQASDGILTASATCAVTVGDTAQTFPHLASPGVSESQYGNFDLQYEAPEVLAFAARCKLFMLNGAPELESYRRYLNRRLPSNQDIAAEIHRLNPQTKVLMYSDTERVYKLSYTTNFDVRRNKMAAQNWYVYAVGASGTPRESVFDRDPETGLSNGLAINVTNYVTRDADNLTAMEWLATFDPSWIFDGAESNEVAPDMDGINWDNVFLWPRQTGDWNRDGTTDSGGQYAEPSGTYYRQGIAAGIAKMRANYPNKLQIGNLGDWPNNWSDTLPDYQGVLDGGVIEHVVGADFSAESWMSTADFIQQLQRIATWLRDEQWGIFGAYPEDASPTNYQAFRHSYTCCMVLTNFLFGWQLGSTTGQYVVYDEYDFYLGTATTNKATAATQDGIWRRDFQNGIALWCPKNVTGTIQLNGDFWVLRGNAAAGRTAGSKVTSITFSSARDGIILSRTPT